jgi:hypothetical protein
MEKESQLSPLQIGTATKYKASHTDEVEILHEDQ